MWSLQAFGTNKAGVVSRGFFETAKPALKKTTSDGGAAPMAEDSVAAPAQDLNDKGEVVTSAAVRVLRSVRGTCDALPQTDRVFGCDRRAGSRRSRVRCAASSAAVEAGAARRRRCVPGCGGSSRSAPTRSARGGCSMRSAAARYAPRWKNESFCVWLTILC